MRLETSVEAAPAGTAGALALAGGRLDDTFFLVNGDSLFDFNWLALSALPAGVANAMARMTLARGIPGERFGRVDTAGERVTSFMPAGPSDLPINAGIYWMRKSILSRIGWGPCSLERAMLTLAPDADHAFHVPAKSGRSDTEVLDALLDAAAAWMISQAPWHRPRA